MFDVCNDFVGRCDGVVELVDFVLFKVFSSRSDVVCDFSGDFSDGVGGFFEFGGDVLEGGFDVVLEFVGSVGVDVVF